ncbi:MAG: sigma-70 family RNA polymerase sigma factor [Verrucomicrobiota bacterium]
METLVDNPIKTEAEGAGRPVLELASDEFAELYQAHSREIYYMTLRLLGEPHKAEDATHDVFLKAFKKWGDFRGDSSARAWLYRIAINHCSNLRQSWHNRNLVTSADESIWENAAARTDSPLRVLEIKELGQRIQKTLDALSDEYRLLLLLVADEELSYDEIAALVGQSADAVRGKLHRARKVFAAHFEKTA